MKKDLSGKKAVEALSAFVNRMGFNKRGFVAEVMSDHRFLQQEMFDLFFSCMIAWSEQFKEKNYDGRNERACRLSNEIIKALSK